MARILIVEDDKDMLKGLKFNLEARGFAVISASNGEIGYRKGVEEKPDLVLLDIMLPGRNGFEVCHDLKKAMPALPVIMLTARGQESDIVTGLDLGADDYVTKPFGVLELLARINAVLRRTGAASDGKYVLDGFEIDFSRYEIRRNGVSLTLSPLEFHILRCLVENRGQAVTRESLLNGAWGYDTFPTTRTVDVHIARLRQKIEEDPEDPRIIITIHGIGYKWVG